MELLEPDIIFRPSLNKAIFNNFFTIFNGLIEDIFQMAELVPRIHKVESNFPTNNNFLFLSPEERDVFQLLGNSSKPSRAEKFEGGFSFPGGRSDGEGKCQEGFLPGLCLPLDRF